jgi:lysophospholipase L1-like esterase
MLPWPQQRRPLSVVAFGNSVATLQLPPRTDRSQGTYVEVMADVLTGEGVPTLPHLESKWFDFLVHAVRDYERRIRTHAPDVVVVQFGLNEYQPWLVPVPVIRHLMVQNQAATRTAKAYRKFVAVRAWKAVRGYRRRVAPLVGMRTWQTTPRRFAKTLERFLRNVRLEARPLVLVLDIDHPGPVLQHFLPGIEKRHAVFQELIAQVVDEVADPEVRLVRVSEVTAALGPAAMTDSMHYTTDTHEVVGRVLADEVLRWLKERGS